MRFGWRGALPLAAASVAANNFFVQPPAFAFQAATAFDEYAFAGLLFVSFSRELVAWCEGSVGAFLRRLLPYRLIAPCSNGVTKMPSGRRASRRARLVLRRLNGRSLPSSVKMSKA
jgi:hypothetical protein